MKFVAAVVLALLLLAIPGCGQPAPAGPTKAELLAAYKIAKARHETAVKDAEKAKEALDLTEKAMAASGGEPTIEAEQRLNQLRQLRAVADKSVERTKEEMNASLARVPQ